MLINDILKEANDALASDVHITVGIVPRMRVFGTMISMNQERITKSDTEDMAFKMMTEKQKKHLEKYGEIDIAYSIPNVGRYRVNIFKQRGTITLSLRLVGTKIPDITKLGIPKSVMDLYSKKKGLVLVTGPTGSGKSTTIASIIDYMNHHRAGHIITLEDPIEYLHCHEQCIINQREIGIDTLSYQNGLHAALREDPDVIFVGELRDYETISLAITAAETGHLVLSTMHTTSVEHTIERMIDLFPPYQQRQIRLQLANTIEAIISQQLLVVDDKKNRIAAYEVLHSTNAVKHLIREEKTYQLHALMQSDEKFGMMTMDDSIQQLYYENVISRDTAIQFATDPDNMEHKLF